MRDVTTAICERLAQVRQQHYGSRGKAQFARDLGIRPSTYTHYELDRQPPADILLKAARLTRTRLDWLITGEGEPSMPSPTTPAAYADELLEQLRQMLHGNPRLLPHAETFIGMLHSLQSNSTVETAKPRPQPEADRSGLIPIVGSTSAGTARYWHERPESTDGPIADAQLESLIVRCSQSAVETPAQFGQAAIRGPVSLVQLAEPNEHGVLEFLSATEFKAEYPDCIAWRIDGDSMSPRYRDGDLVLTSSQHPAVNGYACVARQRNQLGVNCKLFRHEGDVTWLIPVNASYPNQRVPTTDILWAWRVLASVRIGSAGR